jgi:hypothetical protein
VNCGTDGLDAACTVVGVRVSTIRLDSNKKVKDNVKNLFKVLIDNIICDKQIKIDWLRLL